MPQNPSNKDYGASTVGFFVDKDNPLAAARLAVKGRSRVTITGYNPDIDTGTVPETLWPVGGLYAWKPSAGHLEVVSSSANDAVAGTGAQTVFIDGLDAGFNPISETLPLNGLTAVVTANQYYRVNGFYCVTVGATGATAGNAGNITLRDQGAGTTRSYIEAGIGIARQAIYTVPVGSSLYLNSGSAAIDGATASAQAAELALIIRMPGQCPLVTFPVNIHTYAGTISIQRGNDMPVTLDAGADIEVRTVIVSTNNVPVQCFLSAVLILESEN